MKQEQYYPKIVQSFGICVFYFFMIILVLTVGYGYDQQILLEVGSLLAFFLIIFFIKRKYSLNIKNI